MKRFRIRILSNEVDLDPQHCCNLSKLKLLMGALVYDTDAMTGSGLVLSLDDPFKVQSEEHYF